MWWRESALVFLFVVTGFSVSHSAKESVIVGTDDGQQFIRKELEKQGGKNTILLNELKSQGEEEAPVVEAGQVVSSEIAEEEAGKDEARNEDLRRKRRTPRQLPSASSLLSSVSQECGGITLRWVLPNIPFSLIYHSSNPEFSHYNIYRRTYPFTSVRNLKPIASGKDYPELRKIATVSWTDKYPPTGTRLFYAVTVVDHKGRETTTVTPKQVSFFGAIEKTGIDPIDFVAGRLKGDVLHHSLTYNLFRNEYMVAFDLDINKDSTPDQLYAVRLNGMGTIVDKTILNITVNMETTEQGRPSVAFNLISREYLISFQLSAPSLFRGVSIIIGQRVFGHTTTRIENPFVQIKAQNDHNIPIPIVEPKLIYNSGSGGFAMTAMMIAPPKTAVAGFMDRNGKAKSIKRLFGKEVFDTNLFMDTKRQQVYFIHQIAQWSTKVVDQKDYQMKSYRYLIAVVKSDANGGFLNLNTKTTVRNLVGYTNVKNAHIAGYYHENNGWLTVFWNNREKGGKMINSSTILGFPGHFMRQENMNTCDIKHQIQDPATCFLPDNNGHILLWEQARTIGGFLVKDGTFGRVLSEQREPKILYNQRERRAFVVWKQKVRRNFVLFVRNVQPGSQFRCRRTCKSKEKCAMLNVCAPRNPGARKEKQSCSKDNGGCSDTCLSDSKGSSKCSCPNFYTLALDKKKCFLKGAKPDISLLYSSKGSVWSVSVYYQEKRISFKKIPIPGKHIISFYYNKKDKYLYWADSQEDKVYRASLDGSKKTVLVAGDVLVPDGMVVDPDADQLYWTDGALGKIFRYSLINNNKASFLTSLDKPRAIALHRKNKWLYWTTWGNLPNIERINTDGSGRQVLIDSELVWPNALTLDKSSIYWADAQLDKIEMSDLNGQRRLLISQIGVVHPYGLGVAGNRIFWTDWSGDIRTFDKSNSSKVAALVTGIEKPFGLQIYDGTAISKAKLCSDPGVPSHGGRNPPPVLRGMYNIGDRIVLTCNPGFVHLGSNQRKCLPTGKWSGTNTQCKVLPVFTRRPRNKTVDAGSSVTLICSAEGKSGAKVKIHWLKNGTTIPPLPKRYFQVHRSDYFHIISVLVSDTGTYTCVASNDAGSVRSSMYLLVKGKAAQQDCGIAKFPVRAKIIGGRRASRGSIPWQVLLWNTRTNKPFCGGSLLNKHWGVTAAHCLKHVPLGQMEAVLGEHNWKKNEKTEQRLSIDRILLHIQYNEGTYDSDIALFHFSTGAVMTDYVKPICLPTTASDRALLKPGNIGLISGWGARKSGKERPVKTLHQVTVPLVSQLACEKNHPKYTVTSNMFCAGRTDGKGDACQGDSGGPLTIENKKTGRRVLIGIVSWGDKCALKNKYGVYTKIPNYLTWIKDRIKQK